MVFSSKASLLASSIVDVPNEVARTPILEFNATSSVPRILVLTLLMLSDNNIRAPIANKD
jgi:hypothetical protein